jgi:acetyl esterase
MPVDQQIQALLDKGTGVPATNTLSVADARAQYEARIALMAPAAEVGAVTERTIPGPGGDLKLRIYRPAGQGPFPILERRSLVDGRPMFNIVLNRVHAIRSSRILGF